MILRKYLAVFLLLIITGVNVRAEFDGWITEVYAKATKDGEPADWMEIYCADDAEIEDGKVYHMYNDTGVVAKVFPDLTVEKGDYIILHFSDGTTDDETDKTGDTNGNGAWDLYTDHENSSSWGISLSKGGFWITESDGTWVDFVIFIDPTASYPDDYAEMYSTAAANSQWSPEQKDTWTEDDYRDNGVDTEDRDTDISLQRQTSASGMPEDTDTSSDWEMAVTTEGEGYFVAEPVGKMLKVTDSPFFPEDDNPGQPVAGKIQYELPSSDYYLTVTIYDINGYVKKYLIRNKRLTTRQGALFWSGYDEYSGIVPVGIYIVHLRAENVDTGK
ncbi:hypothetical protein ACFLUV_07075, partial [Elusimicrobiota bacterium]